MRAVVITVYCVVAAILGAAAQGRTGTLTIHYIDTEGGQATLFVGPTGESVPCRALLRSRQAAPERPHRLLPVPLRVRGS